MVDWEYKDHERAFCQVPLEESVGRLVALFERYRPDVVVTYDDDGPYDHPDHVRASLVTMAAVERTGIPQKAYFTGMRRGRWDEVRRIMEEQGIGAARTAARDEGWEKRMAEMEAKITTTVDVGEFVDRKRRALGAHVSQMQSGFWGKLPDEAYDAHLRRRSPSCASSTAPARPCPKTTSSPAWSDPERPDGGPFPVRRWRRDDGWPR